MTMSSGSSGQSDAQQQVIDRAVNDPSFRTQLLADPKGAIGEQLGVPLPANMTVRVIEEQPGEVVLVLPAQSMASGTALSDTELEAAAGGGGADSWAPGTDLC